MKNNPPTPCETAAGAQTIHTKLRIIKNVAVMSIGALFLFISYDGLTMLQSTMNNEQGVGVMSQAVLYICFSVSSLISPKYVIQKLGSKLTYNFAMISYIPYIASNFYPHWSLMIPTSMVLGFGAPLLWGSQDIYLSDVSVLFTELLTSGHGKHLCQSGKSNYDKDGNKSSDYGSSVKCKPVDCGTENNCKSIQFANIENGCVVYQSDNPDDKYVGLNEKLQESSPPHVNGHHSSSECQSSCQHEISDGQIPDSGTTEDEEPNRTYSNVKSEVATFNNRNKAIEFTTVSASLDTNQTTDKDSKPKKTGSGSQLQTETDHQTKVLESITARFFGFHGLVYLSSHLWSNLLSYYVLRGDNYGVAHNSSCKCGADFCNAESAGCLHANLQLPSDATRYLLTGICVCLALASVVVVFLFLDPVGNDKKEDVSFSLDFAAATFRLARKPQLLLLMPASLYVGMAQGFFAGEFNKSFVGCAWGSTSQVGPVSICYGAMCAIASLTSGWAVRLAGRPAIFTVAALLNAATCTLLLRWTPDPSQPIIFFVAAGMLGCYLGTVWSQMRAFYGVLFKKDEEAAFATFHMWSSLGFCLSFAITNFLCTSFKIYVLLVVSIAGFVGYFIVERRHANNEIK